uniref:Uncharacterized protein n=1 Tax=Rhodopseudomonas palustris (strain BisA53) TaxID=316055 RepID=Q07JN1_RHOP5
MQAACNTELLGKCRRSPATCSRRRRERWKCHPTSSTATRHQRTGSASSQVLAAAQMLSRDSNGLKLEVGKFLGNIRAAQGRALTDGSARIVRICTGDEINAYVEWSAVLLFGSRCAG